MWTVGKEKANKTGKNEIEKEQNKSTAWEPGSAMLESSPHSCISGDIAYDAEWGTEPHQSRYLMAAVLGPERKAKPTNPVPFLLVNEP